MELFNKEATENTPQIELDHINHKLSFSGDSRPEDVQEFFIPVVKWFENYSDYLFYLQDRNTSEITVECDFKMDYFNSSSAKYILDVLQVLDKMGKKIDRVEVKLNWHYNEMDEDMMEAGEEYEKILGLKFNYCPFS